jgi:lysophospholipase L1-like esterase
MISIWIAGDSTASPKRIEKRPEYGWGEYLSAYLGDGYQVFNHAENGRSTKSFIAEGRLDVIEKEIQSGDILLIQFGHNDQKMTDLSRYADAQSDYPRHLKKYIDVARRKGAMPILLTPVTRCDFKDGILNINTHQDYPNAMKDLAKREHVKCIDLFAITQQTLSPLGPDHAVSYFLHLNPGDSLNYPSGIKDLTHLNEKGARWIASIIADHLKK